MSRQPDDRSWEEEHIYHLDSDIKKLEKQLALAEGVIDNLKPYSVNQRQMVNSYYKYKSAIK